MALLEVRDASFGYAGKPVFQGIGFELSAGEAMCIIGPNGCGKTTLLDCILGINRLDSGDILFGSKSILSMKPHKVAREIAYIPQLHEKAFPYTVSQIVLMGRASHIGLFSAPSEEDSRIVDEALSTVGLLSYKDRPYTLLSGGEGQLVMVARALAQKTGLIIMDEPTSHLDFKNELTVLETVAGLIEKTGVSIIMATHFPNHAFFFENRRIKTKVALMSETGVFDLGPASSIVNEDNLKRLYGVNAKVVSFEIADKEYRQIIPVSRI